MRYQYKQLYEAELEKNTQKDKELLDLQKQVEVDKEIYAKQKIENDATIAKLTEDKTNLLTEKENIETSLADTKERLRVMELSRFAAAYEKQESDYKSQQKFWFKLNLLATLLLTISILVSIFGIPFLGLDINSAWDKEPKLYLLNLIFLTLFIYTLKQHAHLGNLIIDYANRKTLAQSYQHIVESGGYDDIRTNFLKNAADIFSSEAKMRSSDITIYEALLAKIFGPKEEK